MPLPGLWQRTERIAGRCCPDRRSRGVPTIREAPCTAFQFGGRRPSTEASSTASDRAPSGSHTLRPQPSGCPGSRLTFGSRLPSTSADFVMQACARRSLARYGGSRTSQFKLGARRFKRRLRCCSGNFRLLAETLLLGEFAQQSVGRVGASGWLRRRPGVSELADRNAASRPRALASSSRRAVIALPMRPQVRSLYVLAAGRGPAQARHRAIHLRWASQNERTSPPRSHRPDRPDNDPRGGR